jgi:hypothetical protein
MNKVFLIMTKQEEFENSIETNNIIKTKLLLKNSTVEPAKYDNWAIGYASYYGNIEMVQLLLNDSRINPSDDDNYAFRQAVYGVKLDVIILLLKDKRVDPSDYSNNAIFTINNIIPNGFLNNSVLKSYKKHFIILDLLWNNKKVKNTLRNDQPEIYSKLMKKDITNKIDKF